MRKNEIRPVLNAMASKSLHLGKFMDKDFRNRFIEAHMVLLDLQEAIDAKIEKMQVAFLESYKEEKDTVERLQEKLRFCVNPEDRARIAEEIEGHADYLEQVKAFNERVNAMGKEEVEVPMLDRKTFIEEYKRQEYDPGVVEALWPILTKN